MALSGPLGGADLAQIEELEQELGRLMTNAHTEVMPLIAGVNAVFVAVAQDGSAAVLDEFDITGAEESQEQLRAACEESGYDVPQR